MSVGRARPFDLLQPGGRSADRRAVGGQPLRTGSRHGTACASLRPQRRPPVRAAAPAVVVFRGRRRSRDGRTLRRPRPAAACRRRSTTAAGAGPADSPCAARSRTSRRASGAGSALAAAPVACSRRGRVSGAQAPPSVDSQQGCRRPRQERTKLREAPTRLITYDPIGRWRKLRADAASERLLGHADGGHTCLTVRGFHKRLTSSIAPLLRLSGGSRACGAPGRPRCPPRGRDETGLR